MSTDSESKVAVAGSSAEDIVQRKEVKRSSGLGTFSGERMIQPLSP